LGSAEMKQLQVGRGALRRIGAISIFIATAFGAHTQAAKNGEPMVIAAANVDGYWAGKLRIGSDDIPEILLDLRQDDDVIWGQMVVWHSDFVLTGTLKGNEITLWIGVRGGTLEFKGEVKGDVMEGSAAISDKDGRWSATRFKPPPERPQ
jgi:hypothetical protein